MSKEQRATLTFSVLYLKTFTCFWNVFFISWCTIYCSMIKYKQKKHTVTFPVLDTSAQDSGIATWNRPRISPTRTLCLTEAPGKMAGIDPNLRPEPDKPIYLVNISLQGNVLVSSLVSPGIINTMCDVEKLAHSIFYRCQTSWSPCPPTSWCHSQSYVRGRGLQRTPALHSWVSLDVGGDFCPDKFPINILGDLFSFKRQASPTSNFFLMISPLLISAFSPQLIFVFS